MPGGHGWLSIGISERHFESAFRHVIDCCSCVSRYIQLIRNRARRALYPAGVLSIILGGRLGTREGALAAVRARLERFETSRDPALALGELDGAIDLVRQVLSTIPAGDPDRAGMLNVLYVALQFRFEQAGVLADLDEAIRVGREAVDATPEGHPGRPGNLSNLSSALGMRFMRSKALADLDEAITAGRQAVQTAIPDDRHRPRWLHNLSAILVYQFDRTGELADLDEAIRAGR